MAQFTTAQLEAMLAASRRRDDQIAAEEQARRAAGPQELVPASPSPRKKRPRPDDFPSSRLGGRVAQPSFFDKPKLDRTLSGHDGKVELLSRPRESKFASHESALPKSFAETLAENKRIEAANKNREKQKEERSLGFGDLSKDSRNVLLGGKAGRVELYDKSKGKGKERERSRSREDQREGKKRTEKDETEELLRQAAASGSGGGGIGRPAPKPAAPAAASSTSFAVKDEKRRARQNSDDELDVVGGPKKRSRNKDGTVIEEIEMGPKDFKPPRDDPGFEKLEPYSGIRLKKRLLPHSTVDNLLDGRYHLTPSQIYSLARIDTRQRIDLDPDAVDADWVVIGVLAHKGETRFLQSNPYGGKPPPKDGGDEDEEDDDDEADEPSSKGRSSKKGKPLASSSTRDDLYAAPSRRKRAQKYIRFELVDFSSSRASASGDGKLSVMLVEADTVDKSVDDEGNETSSYKGQGGGAYERFWKESPGAVVAIMNPLFMPYNRNFPTYTLKPTSADSMVVIGRADHLAFCDAVTKDGKPCGSWVDDRAGKFCDYHVKRALQRTGNSRPETYANTASLAKHGTMSMKDFSKSFAPGGSSRSSSSKLSSSASAPAKRKLSPPPAGVMIHDSRVHVSTSGTRTGTMQMRASNVLPDFSASTAARAGASANGLPSRGGGSFIHGVREGPSVSEEKERRRRQAQADKLARRELRELVGRDKGLTNGGELLKLARERSAKAKKGAGSSDAEDEEGAGRKGSEGEEAEEERKPKRRSVLSGLAARKIGFDPTAKPGEVEKDKSKEANEFRSLLENGLTGSTRGFDLSAPPGPKIRSVGAPDQAVRVKREAGRPTKSKEERMVNLDDDDDLVVEGGPAERVKISLAGFSKA
ncbi:hypothetical protein JCM10207_001611 [Rhodosporidiobolus poonsookiae]